MQRRSQKLKILSMHQRQKTHEQLKYKRSMVSKPRGFRGGHGRRNRMPSSSTRKRRLSELKFRIIVRDKFKFLWDDMHMISIASIVEWQSGGNLGIGKSFFLRYALARGLVEGRNIILYEQPEFFLH
ncbi:hypothetical protein CPB84DRAFT_1778947 [Gymnopilus junonius]|uniref:Uncharacterized protein n=1 Tax=Gymnopilus junonius TaxID=109634 RepID=A0A9P5NPA1_GYMJU|nr:hypothetical protein CPB84DRAFT_1778947 [Gymnopilus junonius]